MRPADRGFRAYALPGRERIAEEPVRDRPGDPLHQGQLVRPLDLTLHLGLADDHRIEPAGHAEEVAHRLDVAQRIQPAEQLGGPHLGLARERGERDALGLHRITRHQVDLGAVAGGDGHRLADLRVGHELVQEAGSAPLGQRKALAQGHRRGLVGDAEGEELAHQTLTFSCVAASPFLCSAKPARPKLSACTPPGMSQV